MMGRKEISVEDTKWMQRALLLARRAEGRTRPNPPVGAVVVKRGVSIGEGYHKKAGGSHAEVEAIASVKCKTRGATIYVTLEPCSTYGKTPPCVDLIMSSGISRVVVGVKDPNPLHSGRGLRILRKNGVKVDLGVCRKEATELLAPFAKWMTTGKPFLTLKMGMTLDGRIADSKGKSKWITCSASRKRVHLLRRKADAIIVGSGTVIADNPSLRWSDAHGRNPFRIIADTTGRIPLNAKVLTDGYEKKTIIATTSECSKRRCEQYRKRGVRVWVLPKSRGHVSMRVLFGRLAKEGILHVLCEGGAGLAEALIRADLVDKYLFFIAPLLLGGKKSLPVVTGRGWSLAQAKNVKFTGSERVGDDILLLGS